MEKKQNLQSVAVISKLFGISERHVQRLAADGVLPAVSKRPYKFDLLPTIQIYIRHLKGRIEEKQRGEEYELAEYEKLRAEADLKQHQEKLLKMQVKDLENQMHDAEDVKDMYDDLIAVIREKILQLPDQVAGNLRPSLSALEGSNIIREECFRILNQLAAYEYDPEEAARRRKDRAAAATTE